MNKSPLIVVEDDMLDADLIKRALQESKITNPIVHFSDGLRFLKHIQDLLEKPESDLNLPVAIMLDIKMPFLSGLEILERIKGNPVMRNTPVIMVSSSQEGRDLNDSYRLGANSYVVKPIDVDEFFASIAQLGSYWTDLNEQPVAKA